MSVAVDHLVIGAASLAQGVAWCEATLGITPGPGGQHALMSTQNRLFALSAARFPACYAEIIAIDPQAPVPSRTRWFGLDRPEVRAALEQSPRLLHWAMRTSSLDDGRARMLARGADPGAAVAFTRAGTAGLLRWRLTVREDGELLVGGALPSLIEWQGAHPADSLPLSGVSLEGLTVRCADFGSPAIDGVDVHTEPEAPGFEAHLRTPLGPVTLQSHSI